MTRMQHIIGVTLAPLTFNGYADTTDRMLERKADAVEDRADSVRERGEVSADAIEDSDPGMDSDATENAADAARDSSEAHADALEEETDAVRLAK